MINADSKQIYRHLNIGSAKPSKELMAQIPHYLIDIKEPHEPFSVGEFVKLADEAYTEIVSQNRVPIVCGGTAYYFKHFYYGLPTSPKSDPEVRKIVNRKVEERGLEWAHKELQRVDPLSAEKIHPADRYRLTRALEVYQETGKPLSTFTLPTQARKGINPLIIGLNRDKDELLERLEERVTEMFNEGLEDEIERLFRMGAKKEWPAMQGIGYREFFEAKENPSMGRRDIAHLIVRNSRQYAKRQMTFFKSLPNVNWVHPDEEDKIIALINRGDNY